MNRELKRKYERYFRNHARTDSNVVVCPECHQNTYVKSDDSGVFKCIRCGSVVDPDKCSRPDFSNTKIIKHKSKRKKK